MNRHINQDLRFAEKAFGTLQISCITIVIPTKYESAQTTGLTQSLAVRKANCSKFINLIYNYTEFKVNLNQCTFKNGFTTLSTDPQQ